MKVYPVMFQLDNGLTYKTAMPAYSNGGAENKVLDLIPGRVYRCLAFDPENENKFLENFLYPNAEFIDCVELYRLNEKKGA